MNKGPQLNKESGVSNEQGVSGVRSLLNKGSQLNKESGVSDENRSQQKRSQGSLLNKGSQLNRKVRSLR